MESVYGVQGVGQGQVVAVGVAGVVLVAVGVITVAGELGNRQSLAGRVGIETRYATGKMW